jgi:hypothetical protein
VSSFSLGFMLWGWCWVVCTRKARVFVDVVVRGWVPFYLLGGGAGYVDLLGGGSSCLCKCLCCRMVVTNSL